MCVCVRKREKTHNSQMLIKPNFGILRFSWQYNNNIMKTKGSNEPVYSGKSELETGMEHVVGCNVPMHF